MFAAQEVPLMQPPHDFSGPGAAAPSPLLWFRPDLPLPLLPIQSHELRWVLPPSAEAIASAQEAETALSDRATQAHTGPDSGAPPSRGDSSAGAGGEEGEGEGRADGSASGPSGRGRGEGTTGAGAPEAGAQGEGEGKGEGEGEFLRIVAKASTEPLTPEELHLALQAVSSDDNLSLLCQRIPPRVFPLLVAQNPSLAGEMLVRLVPPSTSQVRGYALYEAALMRAELSLQAIEVVNRVLTAVAYPTNFVLEYLSHCFAACHQCKDKYSQNRQVRLLCMFIHSLLRNKTVYVQDVFIEVQAFCIEFSRIKEAAALFKLLKNLDNL